MANYRAMYTTLFQSQTQAIDILMQAQQTSEEMFISADESGLKLLKLGESEGEE